MTITINPDDPLFPPLTRALPEHVEPPEVAEFHAAHAVLEVAAKYEACVAQIAEYRAQFAEVSDLIEVAKRKYTAAVTAALKAGKPAGKVVSEEATLQTHAASLTKLINEEKRRRDFLGYEFRDAITEHRDALIAEADRRVEEAADAYRSTLDAVTAAAEHYHHAFALRRWKAQAAAEGNIGTFPSYGAEPAVVDPLGRSEPKYYNDALDVLRADMAGLERLREREAKADEWRTTEDAVRAAQRARPGAHVGPRQRIPNHLLV